MIGIKSSLHGIFHKESIFNEPGSIEIGRLQLLRKLVMIKNDLLKSNEE